MLCFLKGVVGVHHLVYNIGILAVVFKHTSKREVIIHIRYGLSCLYSVLALLWDQTDTAGYFILGALGVIEVDYTALQGILSV